MAIKRRVLGRGLEALLGSIRSQSRTDNNGVLDYTVEAESALPITPQAAINLSIDLITPGLRQPRQSFSPESLQDLADSISIQGVLQPIVVRPVANGRYEIIAGERRWRASQIAGLTEIPAVIRIVDESVALALGFIENNQRDSLTPLEEARTLNRLITEFGLTQQELAQAIGKSRTTVTNLLKLLDLEPEAGQYLETNQIEAGHARILLGLKGEQQNYAARRVIANKLSIRESEKLVRRLQLQNNNVTEPPEHNNRNNSDNVTLDPDVYKLQNDLSARLGAKVDISYRKSGNGKIIIYYNNLNELDGILTHIK